MSNQHMPLACLLKKNYFCNDINTSEYEKNNCMCRHPYVGSWF